MNPTKFQMDRCRGFCVKDALEFGRGNRICSLTPTVVFWRICLKVADLIEMTLGM